MIGSMAKASLWAGLRKLSKTLELPFRWKKRPRIHNLKSYTTTRPIEDFRRIVESLLIIYRRRKYNGFHKLNRTFENPDAP